LRSVERDVAFGNSLDGGRRCGHEENTGGRRGPPESKRTNHDANSIPRARGTPRSLVGLEVEARIPVLLVHTVLLT
jgi:hypothetical protein